jgi:ADP-ribose pyrophosphatase YjhB (NUDIX family)
MTSNPERQGLISHVILRRALHTYWRFARGLTLGVRAAVIDPDSNVFLIRHTYVPGWHLPGGGVEAGETALDALNRELREEGCIAPTAEPQLHGIFFNSQTSRRDHVLVYVVRRFAILAEKQPDREIAETGFFPIDGLPDNTSPATRRRLDEIMSGRAPAPTW